jgi:hypothetical protein
MKRFNVYRDLATFLNNNGIENYSIGQHEGRCENPFVVIEDLGELRNSRYTLRVRRLNIVVMFPKGKYSELDDYIDKVLEVMSGYDRTVFTDYISDVMIDTDKDAYVAVLEYKLYIGV